MESTKNIFDEVIGDTTDTESEGAEDYEAFDRGSDNLLGIIITYVDKNTKKLVRCMPAYSNYVNTLEASSESITLVFTSEAIIIHGENLGRILEMVQKMELSQINIFEKGKHKEPASGEAKVTHIERKGLKEKEPKKNKD